MPELTALFSLASSHNGYWMTYLAVTGAILGYQISGREFSRKVNTKLLLSVVFFGFALSNVTVIYQTDQIRRELVAQVTAMSSEETTKISNHHVNAAGLAAPGPCWLVVTLHILLDVGVMASIWILPKHSLKFD